MRLIVADRLVDVFLSKPYDSYGTKIVVRMIQEEPTVRIKGAPAAETRARLVTKADFCNGAEDDGEAIPCWKESRKPTRRSGWAVIVWGKALADKGTARYWTTRPTDRQREETPWESTAE